jgi:hypothetical protein
MTQYIISTDNINNDIFKENLSNDINMLNIDKSDNYVNIFVNLSIQSNSFTDILNDKHKIIKNKCNIYIYKYDKIEYIMSINVINNNIYDKLINIIFSRKSGYYSKDKQLIFDFIKINKLDKYLLYN